jgi:hypothetical protein
MFTLGAPFGAIGFLFSAGHCVQCLIVFVSGFLHLYIWGVYKMQWAVFTVGFSLYYWLGIPLLWPVFIYGWATPW